MEKFFKYFYRIISSRYFKFILVIGVICVLFFSHFRGNFNKDKFLDVVEQIKKDDKRDGEVVKKQITREPDKNVITEEVGVVEKKEEDPRIKKVTNIFLKLKELEVTYNNNLKNNKINYNRVIKENDTVYYSLKSIFNDQQNSKDMPEIRMFMIVTNKDLLSKKLLGKRIGQKVLFNQDEFLSFMGKEERENVQKLIKSNIDNLNNKYGKGKQIFKSYNITYELQALDFISGDIMKELNLQDNLN